MSGFGDRVEATGQEIEALRRTLAARTAQLDLVLRALRERDAADAEQQGWDFALQLQTGALPQDFPAFPDRGDFDIRAGMITAQDVGGDLYDFFLLDQQRLAFTVADASGKGLAAAEFITACRTLLRASAKRIADPGACLAMVNGLLSFDNPGMMFVTALYGVLDTRTGDLRVANAGHHAPLILSAGRPPQTLSAAPELVLGIEEDWVYSTVSARLRPGDTLICFSDGVIEAHDVAGDLYGSPRLDACVAGRAADPLETVLGAIVADVDRFMGVAPIADDLTVLVLRFLGESSDAARSRRDTDETRAVPVSAAD